MSGDVTLDDREATALVSGVDMGDAPRSDDPRAGAWGDEGGESASSDEEDYVDKLDQQLETMYEEYKTRTQRRVSAALKVEEQDAGGRSKANAAANANPSPSPSPGPDPDPSPYPNPDPSPYPNPDPNPDPNPTPPYP